MKEFVSQSTLGPGNSKTTRHNLNIPVLSRIIGDIIKVVHFLVHNSSYFKFELFCQLYLQNFVNHPLTVLDFGSQSVDNSPMVLRNVFKNTNWNYIGVDIVSGFNVDLVLKDPYSWSEIDSNSVDVLVSGQTFEHIEFFWVTMFEIARVLKPGGVAVLIAPSGGFEHRYPVDCWRFYRDGFAALSKMVEFKLLESFTDWGRLGNEVWADSIGIFQKPIWDEEDYVAFNRKYLAAHQILPIGSTTILPIPIHEKTEPSILSKMGPERLTPTMEKIRIEDINWDAPLYLRLRSALSLVLGRKGTLILNNLLRRKIHGGLTSWGTNTNILSD